MYDLTAMGELLIDFTQLSTDGEGYPTLAAHPGGAPGNFLAALCRYGASAAFLGKVGDDAFGRLLVDTLARAGIETRGIRVDPTVFTTLAFVTLVDGERSFSFARKPGADTVLRFDELELSLIDQSRAFHFGALSLTDEPARSATRQAVAYARAQGKLVTFDPNYRPPLWRSEAQARAETLWGLEQADVVKLSDEELSFLWGCTPEEGARRLREECGVALAMITLGPQGCYLENARGACRVPAPAVRPVDTTGAGDIFGGSAVAKLLALDTPPAELEPGALEGIASFALTAASLSPPRPRRPARQLLRLAQERGVSREIEVRSGGAGPKTAALAHLEGQLFAPRPDPWAGEAEELTMLKANSPYSEVEWTAAEILRLVREEGYRFRDIAVCARSLEGCGSLVETIFARYGVPVFLSRMSDILQKPILALITSALEAASGGYRYDDVFRYLKTGLTGLSAEDVDLLENYVLKWSLEGSAWTGARDWANHPRGYGLPFSEGDRALLARLNTLRRQVAQTLEGLRKNPDKTGRGQAAALYAFLEAAGVPERLAQRTEELNRRGQAALAEEYAQLWEILCGGLEQCAQILGDAPMELDEFSKLFALVLSQYDVGSIPVSLDRVNVGDMPRLAHRACPVVFLLGADDGAIPAAAPSPGLLNDDDRSLLASYGLELAPRLSDKLYREMTIVYETCALPQRRFYLSWAAAGPDGEERRPSFLQSKLNFLFPQARRVEEGRLDGSFRLAAPRPALELAGRFPQAGAALRALPEYAPLVERMERAARMERGRLTRPAVDALYGRRVPMSASRMDKYKSCHFSYFMQYGLKAEPRRAAGVQAPEYGTFVHYVLEHVLRACRERGGVKEVPAGELRALAQAAVERYVSEELGGLEHETARFRYLFRRLLKSVYAVVDNVAEELRASRFQPISFELGFGAGKDLPPVELSVDGMTVSISGFVDRVDGWEHDGRLYLRVVDYKTGRKTFDLTDIWNGMGLQMLLYLFTLEREGEALYNREIIPAGVLYLPARDAVVAGSRAMSEAERRRKVDAELRRRGIVLDEPEVLAAMEEPGEAGIRFLPVKVNKAGAITGEALVSAERLGKLARHTGRILEEIGRELAAGNIAADPFWRGPDHNACQWCEYAAACHFEEGRGGDRRRFLPAVRSEEFWQAVAKEQV